MLNLGYDAYFELLWNEQKASFVNSTSLRKLIFECPKCRLNSRDASIMSLLWFFPYIYLPTNDYIPYHNSKLDEYNIQYAYKIFIFVFVFLHANSQLIKIWFNHVTFLNWSFIINLLTYVSTCSRICATSNKKEIILIFSFFMSTTFFKNFQQHLACWHVEYN